MFLETLAIIFLILGYYYITASVEHRNEFINVYIYWCRYYERLPIGISRAFDPLISLFAFKYFGICTEFICVIVRNENNKFLVGKRTKKKYYTHDVGACGMVQYGESEMSSAKRELREELGFEDSMSYIQTVIPYDGYTGICHIFICEYEPVCARNTINLNESDTYLSIDWTSSLKEYIATSKDKPIFNYNMLLLERDKIL